MKQLSQQVTRIPFTSSHLTDFHNPPPPPLPSHTHTTFSLSLSLSLSLSHTHTHTHTQYILSLSLSLTHTHTTHTLSLSFEIQLLAYPPHYIYCHFERLNNYVHLFDAPKTVLLLSVSMLSLIGGKKGLNQAMKTNSQNVRKPQRPSEVGHDDQTNSVSRSVPSRRHNH